MTVLGSLSRGQRSVVAAAALAVATAAASHWAAPRVDAAERSATPGRAPSFPTLGPEQVAERPLPMRVTGERGALRFGGVADGVVPELIVVGSASGDRSLDVREPDFSGDGFVEFYGLDAGPCCFYLRVGERSSGLRPIEVPVGGLIELPLPELTEGIGRQLRLFIGDAPLLDNATVLFDLGFGRFLLPWRGQPLELDWPIADPRQVWVRIEPSGQGAVARLGAFIDRPATVGPLDVRIPDGKGSLALSVAGEDEELDERSRFGLSVDARAADVALAALSVDDFSAPPTITALAHGDRRAEALAMIGLVDGSYRVGVGSSSSPAALIWREFEVEPEASVALALDPRWSSEAERGNAYHRRLLSPALHYRGESPRETLLGSSGFNFADRNGSTVGHGPREVWSTRFGSGGSRAVLIGFESEGQSGDYRALDLARAPVTLPPLPVGAEAEVEVSLTSFVAGRALAEFSWRSDEVESFDLGQVPDGLLTASAERDGRPDQALEAFIVDGQIVHDGWRPVGRSAEELPVEVDVGDLGEGATLSLDGGGPALLGSEAGARIAFDAGGADFRLVHRRLADEVLDEHLIVGRDGARASFPALDPRPVPWGAIADSIGFVPERFGFDSLELTVVPTGESGRLAAGSPAALPDVEGAVVEATADIGRARLWAVLPPASVLLESADPPRTETAQLLVTAVRPCEVYVATGGAVVRCALNPQQPLELELFAPGRVSIARIFESDDEPEQVVVAALLADDVLTLHLD